MPDRKESTLGINSWLEDELYQQYLHDSKNVDESWKSVFDEDGAQPKPAPPEPESTAVVTTGPSAPVAPEHPVDAFQPGPAEQLVPLRGAGARIADNMAASVWIPTATSQRSIPVKVVDE